jgi:hypothetical protein
MTFNQKLLKARTTLKSRLFSRPNALVVKEQISFFRNIKLCK